jgi:hypothetical protein
MSWIVAALAVLQAPLETVEPQDPDRPRYAEADLKSLRESNIFSPKGRSGASSGRRDERRPETRTEPPPPARPKPIQVTGFILDPETKTSRAILEDKNDEKTRTLKEPLFAKAGDTAAGWTVEEVTSEQVTIVKDEDRKVLKVGESFPDPDGVAAAVPTASAETPAATPPAAVDDASRGDVLERLKNKNKKKRSEEQ